MNEATKLAFLKLNIDISNLQSSTERETLSNDYIDVLQALGDQAEQKAILSGEDIT